jgi:hypothetical protein
LQRENTLFQTFSKPCVAESKRPVHNLLVAIANAQEIFTAKIDIPCHWKMTARSQLIMVSATPPAREPAALPTAAAGPHLQASPSLIADSSTTEMLPVLRPTAIH